MVGYYYREYGDRGPRKRRRTVAGAIVHAVLVVLSAVCGVALTLTLLAPFVHPGGWWIFPILGLVAPAVYAATLLIALFWVIRWRWRIALPLLVLLVLGLFRVPLFVKPELRRHYGEEKGFGRGAVTFLTYNVRGFCDDRGQWDFDRIARTIREVDPDIVCLQEFNRPRNGAVRFDTLLPGYVRTVVEEPGRNPLLPMALYTKTKHRILGASHSLLGPMLQDGQSVWVDLRIGDDTVRVINNHLHSTAITVRDDDYLFGRQFLSDTTGGEKIRNIFRRFRDNSTLRAAQADTIARAMASMPRSMIVCGDFNDTPMSYTYRTMSRGMTDAFRAAGKGYSYTYKGFMNVLRIDYVLFSDEFECVDYRVLYDADYSDHYPVVVRLKKANKS